MRAVAARRFGKVSLESEADLENILRSCPILFAIGPHHERDLCFLDGTCPTGKALMAASAVVVIGIFFAMCRMLGHVGILEFG